MLVLTSYADFPLIWGGREALPLVKYNPYISFDYERYERGVRAYLSDNMVFYLEMGKLINLTYPNFYLSVVRRDGREFAPMPYILELVDKFFPKGYEVQLMSSEEAMEHGFPFLYPLWVYEGWVYRQTKRHYEIDAVSYATIQWVNK